MLTKQQLNSKRSSVVMLPGSTDVVRGVITQWGRQQPFQCCAPPEVEKHESFEVNGTHSSHKIVRQRSQVEGEKEWRHRDRELLQLVFCRDGVHLYPHSRCSGEHQIVQWAILRGIGGEWVAVFDDCRNAS